MTKLFQKLSITQRISLSFLLVIATGSILLSLPIFHVADAPATTYLDHLFTTVSMVCVTGLSVFAVADVYNRMGQILCLCLIQIGGLGLVSLIALSYYTLRRKLSLSNQATLQSAISKDSHKGLRDYLYHVFQLTFAIEGICALILMLDFIPRYGWSDGIFNSIFIAISAFCNAGFDNLGSNSLMDFAKNPLINLTVAFLILAGGLGFGVWFDLRERNKKFLSGPLSFKQAFHKISIQTRLVLYTNAIILSLGTLISWILERTNPETIGTYALPDQLLVSFFQTVTMRTAGFATISYSAAEQGTNFFYMLQMAIGGSPGGTAGGLKVTIAAVIFLLFRAEIKGHSHVSFHYRTISDSLIKQTLTVLIFFFTVLVTGYLLLLETEPTLNPFGLLFEVFSALATVGVTMDITPHLSIPGRFIVMALMFIGRVGPITVLLSLRQRTEKSIPYAKADLILG
ncbi:TrkH family potassium uptake protein [Streptococcus caprae]|uniref:TrkH family potassium uptake protein n=1 Tax=Streptococcus caprae TaxID=1640501 RepID=A0ABV8CVQ7_9STRE